MTSKTQRIYRFLGLLAAMLLAGCYDYDRLDTVEPQPVDILSRFNDEGKAWLNLQIVAGDAAKTRVTDDNGQFADGEDNVSADAYVFIFAGTSEATARFASAYKAAKVSDESSELSQISRTLVITSDHIKQDDNIYVFVLLNNNDGGITTVIPATGVTSVTFDNGSTLTGGTSTFANLQAIQITQVKDDSNYFIMTNATLSSQSGGNNDPSGATVSTLVPIDATSFYTSEEDAEANPAGIIIVDRLAAKVTVNLDIANDKHYVLGNRYIEYADADLTFALDNYNTSSLICKNFDSQWLAYTTAPGSTSAQTGKANYYRFVEEQAIMPDKYRTYWGWDVNSSSSLTFVNNATYYGYTPEQKAAFWQTMGSSVYCAENTMSVGKMTNDSTTSVLVRLQLNGGGDFYTTSVTGSDVIYIAPDPGLTEEGTSASSSFVRTRSTAVATARPIDEYLLEWLWQTNAGFRSWVRTYAAGELRHVQITMTNNGLTGLATASVTQTARTSGNGVSEFTALGLAAYINGNMTIRYYENGYCYYRVLIRHFGDELTPWASAPAMTGNSAAQAYGGNAQNYLGRYGLVRNNWYTVTLDGVSHVGSPIIPPLTTDADDQVEQLLNATLRISGWEVHEMILQ